MRVMVLWCTLWSLVLLLLLECHQVSGQLCQTAGCQCLTTTRGNHLQCLCKQNQDLNLTLKEIPKNTYNITVNGCDSVMLPDSLSSLPLNEITFKNINKLHIATDTFLFNARHLVSIKIEGTEIPVIPSFSFSSLDNIFRITFENVKIGTISTDAFSDLKNLRHMTFLDSEIGSIEHNAFGRGNSHIDNFMIEGTNIDILEDGALWLSNAEIVQIDKCTIKEMKKNAIKLNAVFYFYLTRSAIHSFEAAAVTGSFFTGVMIDNDYINPVLAVDNKPKPLFDLQMLSSRRSSVPRFLHFTNNIITKPLHKYPIFIPNPSFNVAVPNNTLGECSCSYFRNYLHSLRPTSGEYSVAVHQAVIEHGLCLVDNNIYSIGCPNIMHPVFNDNIPKNIHLPSRELAKKSSITQNHQRKKHRNDSLQTTRQPEKSKCIPTRKNESKISSTKPKLFSNKSYMLLASKKEQNTNSSLDDEEQSGKPQESIMVNNSVNNKSSAIVLNTTDFPKNIMINKFINDSFTQEKYQIDRDSEYNIKSHKNTNYFGKSNNSSSHGSTSMLYKEIHPKQENSSTDLKFDIIQNISLNHNLLPTTKSFNKPALFIKNSKSYKPLHDLDIEDIWNEIFGGIFPLRFQKPLPLNFPAMDTTMKFNTNKLTRGITRNNYKHVILITPR